MEQNRTQAQIHEKGFKMDEYSKLNIEGKKLADDLSINLGYLKSLTYPGEANKYKIFQKDEIYRWLVNKDLKSLRYASRTFYNLNGVYKRACDYAAYLYRYDWYIASEQKSENISKDKILTDFNKILDFLDNSHIKEMCGRMALNTVLDGVYYGYIVPSKDRLIIQDLPLNRCRSRFFKDGVPVVEFDMSYFNSSSSVYSNNILKLFPDEFTRGFQLYKNKKLFDEYGQPTSWYILTPGSTVKFSMSPDEMPLFISSIPAILDLDAAQDLDRRKQLQKLLKIIVQKLPLDKNGDLIFDIEEADDIHRNAVKMLSKAIGVDILTTFADVQAIDTFDRNSATTTDDIERVERTVFNALGLSKNLFNTQGNTALEKSILNDESSLRGLLLQFARFFNSVVEILNNNKKYNFKLYMLETTQYNYKEMAKLYKEQIQYGYSKMLPQIALGHSQSFILSSVKFENEILDLNHVMLPPLSSNTMNAEDFEILGKNKQQSSSKNQNNTESKNETGRPALKDDEKSDKTLANEASKG